MCKKVALSLSEPVDRFLTEQKAVTGLPKSQLLTLFVTKYGEDLAKELSKYSKKGAESPKVSASIE